MKFKQAWALVRQAVSSWSEDRAPSMGAALSYYTVFSIAPLLLIAISVAGLVFGADAARGAVVYQLQGLLGEPAAQAIQSVLQSVAKPRQGIIATLIGVLLLLVGATTVLAELQSDLDLIWKAPARARASGVWGLARSRVLSVGMIMGIGFLLLVSLVVSAGISALSDWWGPMFGAWEVLAQLVNAVVSFVLVTALFALIYRFMPAVRIKWHDVVVGAAVTALLFTVGKFVIGLYIGKSSVGSGFGAAGSLAVLLVWVYYSAQIFLFGAEFTQAYAHAYGSHSGTQAAARPAAQRVAMQPAMPVPAESRMVYPVAAEKTRAPSPPRLSGRIAATVGAAAALAALSAWGLRRFKKSATVPSARTRVSAARARSHDEARAVHAMSRSMRPVRPVRPSPVHHAAGVAGHAAIAIAKSMAVAAAMAVMNSVTRSVKRGFRHGLPAGARQERMRVAG